MPNHHLLRLSHSLLLPELELINFHYERYHCRFRVRKKSRFEVCPKCATKAYGSHDRRICFVKDAPYRQKSVELVIEKRRFRCPACKSVFTEPIAGLVKGRRTTQRFRRALCEAAEHYVSLSLVRKRFKCSSFLRYKVLYEQLELKQRTRSHPWPKVIGLDDNRFGKHPHYRYTQFSSVFVDYKNKRVFELADSREASVLKAQLAHIPGREKVQKVIIDLSPSYKSFVKSFFPNAKIIADHFHTVRLMHPHINRLRKNYTGDKRSHPIRKLLLRNGATLKFHERRTLEKWLQDKPVLRQVYTAKEALHRLYRCRGYKRAERALQNLTDHLAHSNLPEIKTLRRTLMNWRYQILEFFNCRYTNGRTEGFNNKIKLLKKQAYGYKNHENFRLRVLNACA